MWATNRSSSATTLLVFLAMFIGGAVGRFKDITNVWSTIRELDVRDIHTEAEQPVRFALIGIPELRQYLTQMLTTGAMRFPSRGTTAIDEYNLPLIREETAALTHADLIILIGDGRTPITYDEYLAYEKATVLDIPIVMVWMHTAHIPESATGVPRGRWKVDETVFIADPTQSSDGGKQTAKAIVEALPEQLRVAAARRYPGLRPAVANELTQSIAMSNATYSLTSGIPEMIPVLNLPLNAADMLILTKNQALMAYRIALAMGSETEFKIMIRELLSVIGSGFLWRQLARQLVGLIPGAGILPKVAVAYAGTYTTGEIVERWYGSGELVSRETIKHMLNQALEEGRERARNLLGREDDAGEASREKQPGLVKRTFRTVRSWLPGDDEQADSDTTKQG